MCWSSTTMLCAVISAQARLRELLDRSKEGTLTEAEKNELDEMRHLDHLVSSIKAAARQHLREAA